MGSNEIRRFVAEAIGTFVLVAVGSLSIVAAAALNSPILVVVALGFGLGLMAAIHIAGHVSGGHFNPAVTLGALLDRRIGPVEAVGYVVSQVVGALAASGLILVLLTQNHVAATRTRANVDQPLAFLAEVVFTAIFVAVILTVIRRNPGHAGFAIPLALVAIHLAGIPLTGASVNPARSLAPALLGGELEHLWIYLTAPFVGAVLGWLVASYLNPPEPAEGSAAS